MSVPEPLAAPRYVLWELTRACNLRCAHCAQGGGPPRPRELTTREALRCCDELADWGVGAVCLMGGEPLVRPDWARVAARLARRDVPVGLVTNGLLLDDERLARMADLGVVEVCVSLDGSTAALHDAMRGRPGAWDRAMAAIDRLARSPIPGRKVLTAVSRRNLADLPALLALLRERAAGFAWSLLVATVHDPRRFAPTEALDVAGHVRLARFLRRARRGAAGRLAIEGSHGLGYFAGTLSDASLHDWTWRGCVAGIETLGLRSDGDVVGCLILPDAFVEGNVRERPPVDVWRDERAFGWTRRFRRNLLRGACRGCAHGAECRGGCTNRAVEGFGRPFEAPVCLRRIEAGRAR